MTVAVDIVRDPERAQVLLDRTRLTLLDALEEPKSAAGLARALDLPRQRVNYHLRELEAHRLVELVEERKRGSVIERTFRRTGTTYAVSSSALGPLAAGPERFQDRFSASYQVALASRTIRELGELQAGAEKAGLRLPTFAAETEVRFASPEARAAFADELTEAIAALVRKYHDERSEDGRAYRLQLGAYPRPRHESES
ncbi:MAG: helix-turn-helix domain-containing protein [Planctomycetota bacterium]